MIKKSIRKVEILQVVTIPGFIIVWEKDDGTFFTEPVCAWAVTKEPDALEGDPLYTVEPMFLTEFGFTLAIDIPNFEEVTEADNPKYMGMERTWEEK